MQAHQIILTSCRRGIIGGGSGFQVYSCDQALALRGFLQGSEYQKLFLYDTPVEVGVSSFGYAHVEGVGSVFSLNTRLEHEFAGEGTRSGNLLNHSLLIDGACPFYPLEVFGTHSFRQEMRAEEVNADNAPDYLPMVDMQPADVINLESVSGWLEDIDGIEVLQQLLGAYFAARQDNKVLVILDEPQNVVRWVAAMEYCLPLKAALRVDFLSYSENAAAAGSVVVGSSREQFEAHTPAYLLPSVVVFDPASCDAFEPIEGPFADFMDMSFGLNPAALAKFATFVDAHIALEDITSVEELDAAHCTFSISDAILRSWTLDATQVGLACALEKGSDELNRMLVRAISSGADEASLLNRDVRMAVLGYLVRGWQSLDGAGRTLVETIAVSDVMALLEQENLDETQFQEGLDAVADACVPAGLNVFEMLMGPSSRAQLEAAAQGLSLPKLRQLAECLSRYVLVTRQSPTKLGFGQPVGDLYACLAHCAFAQGQGAGLGLEQGVVAFLAGDFAYIRAIMPVLDDAALQALGGASVSLAASASDALWDSCIDQLTRTSVSQAAVLAEWFEDMAHAQTVFYQRAVDLFTRLIGSASASREATTLFSAFCGQNVMRDVGFEKEAYPGILQSYANCLIGFGDADAAASARFVLDGVLVGSAAYVFIKPLMRLVSSTFDLEHLSAADMRFVGKAEAYTERTGVGALAGKAALAHVLTFAQRVPLSEHANRSQMRVSWMNALRTEITALELQVEISLLDDRAFSAYAVQLASVVVPLFRSAADCSGIAVALGLSELRFDSFAQACVQAAVRFSSSTPNLEPVIAMVTFCALYGNDVVETVCLHELRCLVKTDDNVADRLRRESYHQLCREGDKNIADEWLARFDRAMNHRSGLFGRFRNRQDGSGI